MTNSVKDAAEKLWRDLGCPEWKLHDIAAAMARVADEERAACLAISDRIRLESGAPTHSTAGMVAAEIRARAAGRLP